MPLNETRVGICGSLMLLFVAGLQPATTSAHEWMAPKQAAERRNPVTADHDSLITGRALFLENCSSCHGENGEGNKAEDVGLKTNPPNLKAQIAAHSDGDFFWKIQHGRNEMPSFAEQLSSDEIWHIINYLRKTEDE